MRIMVDLDAERGRQPRPGHEDKSYCVIRKSKVIRMAAIGAYLTRQIPFDNAVLEAISKSTQPFEKFVLTKQDFLDHVLRQGPSEQYTMIKRSFFSRGANTIPLDNVICALKGVYASMRLCNVSLVYSCIETKFFNRW